MADSPLKNSNGVVSFNILINGTAISSSTEIISVEICCAVNRINTATITISDGDMPGGCFPESDADSFVPGTELSIELGYDAQLKEVFSGIVIKHSVKVSGNNDARLVIECKDKALAMTVGRKSATFIDKKDSDIITQLIGTYSGLSASVTATTTSYKELVQYYASDWDFMLARAEFNGLLVTLEKGAVTVAAPDGSSSPVLTLTYGTDIIEFNAELDARHQYSSVNASSWDLSTQTLSAQTGAQQTLTSQGNITGATLAGVLGLKKMQLQSDAPLVTADLTAWAKAQQLKAELARIRGYVSFQGSAAVKPGTLIELKGVGDRFNGNVFVSSVEHTLEAGNWITRVDFGLAPNWFTEQHSLEAPEASGITAGISGLHIGVVKKLDADPEAQYRVQVTIPILQADSEAVWARLGNFYGSNSFGSFFIPEIGDEVILGFMNQDPSHPIILGSLYSSKNKPPYELTADNFIKAIVTRSKLTMEYDDDKKVITLITPGKNKIVISDDAKSILLEDQTGNTVELNSSGITLDSPKDINISAKGKITLDAVGNIALTSKADVTASGLNITQTANVGFTAKGNASAEVSASGTTTIKGAMVLIN